MSTQEQENRLQELKARLLDREAAQSAREQLRNERKPFDPEAFLQFVTNNPAFNQLHITATEE